MKLGVISRVLALALLAMLSMPAMATFPNVLGDWNGSGTVTDKMCGIGGISPPAPSAGPDETEFDTISITIDVQNDTTGFFSGFVNDEDPGDTTTFEGYLNAGGTIVSGSFYSIEDDGTELSGSISGFFSGNTLNLNVNGQDIVSPSGVFCVIEDHYTLTRSNAPIAPEEAPSIGAVENIDTLGSFAGNTSTTLGGRSFSALRGLFGGKGDLSQSRGMYEFNTGLSAGDDLDLVMLGFWGSYTYTDYENDFSRTRYDGDRHMFLGGVDFSPHEKTVLGISFGWEDADVDTDFNGGEADSDGYTIAPYFGMILDDTWNIDMSGGYSNIETDQYRRAVVGGSPVGARITSEVDTERWFFSANINGFTQQGNWFLTGRAGGLYAFSQNDDFTESDGTAVARSKTKLSQVNIGGEAAYAIGEFEPYISGVYSYDLMSEKTSLTAGSQPDHDRSDFLLGLGFRYFSKDNLSITAEYTDRLGSGDYEEQTLSLNARWDF